MSQVLWCVVFLCSLNGHPMSMNSTIAYDMAALCFPLPGLSSNLKLWNIEVWALTRDICMGHRTLCYWRVVQTKDSIPNDWWTSRTYQPASKPLCPLSDPAMAGKAPSQVKVNTEQCYRMRYLTSPPSPWVCFGFDQASIAPQHDLDVWAASGVLIALYSCCSYNICPWRGQMLVEDGSKALKKAIFEQMQSYCWCCGLRQCKHMETRYDLAEMLGCKIIA